MTKRRYYAVQYAYGSTVINNGNRADEVKTFDSKAERDAWVAKGPDYNGPGYREAISARQARKVR